MTFDEVTQLLRVTSHEDWPRAERGEDLAVAVCPADVNLRLEWERGGELESCGAPWATMHADSNAYKRHVYLYYSSTLFYDTTLVSVDGSRAFLPIPGIGEELRVSRINYAIAQVADTFDSLDDYMRRAGMSVE